MLIKSCTQPGDDCFILFGGSGKELTLCRDLKRNFISCEIHPEYYQMITESLEEQKDTSFHNSIHNHENITEKSVWYWCVGFATM